jgi:hypothetical protein
MASRLETGGTRTGICGFGADHHPSDPSMRRNRRRAMQTLFRWKRLLVALAILLAMNGIIALPAGAVVGGYVEIHSTECPPGYTGNTYFDDCHHTPVAGETFNATGPSLSQDAVTTAEGVIVFGDFLEAGTVTITQTVPTSDSAGYVVYCSRVDNQEAIPFTYAGSGRAVTFDMPADIVEAGGGIVCDWYNIRVSDTWNQVPTGTFELVKLVCEGYDIPEIVVFTPLEVAGGAAEAGHDQCRGATASFQIIPYGDPSLQPVNFDAAIGVNELALPMGDHTLVELATGATATFPIEEQATTRVYVLNPVPAEGLPDPTHPVEVPVTRLPSTGTGGTDAQGGSILLVPLAAILALVATGIGYATRERATP